MDVAKRLPRYRPRDAAIERRGLGSPLDPANLTDVALWATAGPSTSEVRRPWSLEGPTRSLPPSPFGPLRSLAMTQVRGAVPLVLPHAYPRSGFHSLEVRRSERQRAKGERRHCLWPLLRPRHSSLSAGEASVTPEVGSSVPYAPTCPRVRAGRFTFSFFKDSRFRFKPRICTPSPKLTQPKVRLWAG